MGTKLSALPNAAALTGGETLPVVQAGATKRTTAAEVAALATSNGAARDDAVVHNTGAETIGGAKTFSAVQTVNLLAGATPAAGTGHIHRAISGGTTRYCAEAVGDTADAGFIGRKTRGTADSPAPPQSGDRLALFGGQGYGVSGYPAGARAYIDCVATATWDDTSTPAEVRFATNDGTSTAVRWKLRDTGHLAPNLAGTYDLGTPALPVRDLYLHPSASLTPATNGDLVIQLTSNTSLTFKVKGSDGVVRSASITLS